MPMGSSKPARVTGGEQIVDLLYQQVQAVQGLVEQVVAEQTAQFEARMQQRAQENEGWRDVAGDFEAWEDDDGNYTFGVPDTAQSAVQAGLLEYGDDKNPPVPLVRMGVLSDVADIGWRMTDAFRRGGF
jgi:hypothetical protein